MRLGDVADLSIPVGELTWPAFTDDGCVMRLGDLAARVTVEPMVLVPLVAWVEFFALKAKWSNFDEHAEARLERLIKRYPEAVRLLLHPPDALAH